MPLQTSVGHMPLKKRECLDLGMGPQNSQQTHVDPSMDDPILPTSQTNASTGFELGLALDRPPVGKCCNRLKEYTPYSKYQLFWLTENRPPVVFIPFPRDLTDQGLHVTENRSSLAYPAHKGNLLYSKNNKTTFNINPNRADKRSQNRLLANSKTM